MQLVLCYRVQSVCGAEVLRSRTGALVQYLVLRKPAAGGPAPTLKEFMNRYRSYAGLSVSWLVVGPGKRGRRARRGGVLTSYTQCIPAADRHVKTIANSYFIDGVAIHPHNFHFRCARGHGSACAV
jgi:hypothetical protein